jgi:GT2 family glycosyltransferase
MASLSVVVCTRNRVESLRRAFDALAAVTTTHAWELIVVDNGSTDDTASFLESINGRSFGCLRVLTTYETKRGLGAGRNTGWRAAAADLVAFTDDDCYVSKDYADMIMEVFAESSEIGFLGGRILLYDETDYRVTILESDEKIYFSPRSFVAPGAVTGANMAFRRSVLEQIGGFDERLGAGTRFPSCEDSDAVAAALWDGVAGVYDPRPVVYHHHGRKTVEEADALMRNYDAGRGAYYAKYMMNRASRWEFGKAWVKRAAGEFLWAIRRGGIPRMGRTSREVAGAIRYAASGLLPG